MDRRWDAGVRGRVGVEWGVKASVADGHKGDWD